MMMREELEAALAHLPAISGTATDRHSIPADRLLIVSTAARKQLPLLAEDCSRCKGKGWNGYVKDEPKEASPGERIVTHPCPTCHGSGKVYPRETVETIANALMNAWQSDFDVYAVAVLDALGGKE